MMASLTEPQLQTIFPSSLPISVRASLNIPPKQIKFSVTVWCAFMYAYVTGFAKTILNHTLILLELPI